MELTRTPAARLDLDRGRLARCTPQATGRIAPLWPLESFVAVNPYLGSRRPPLRRRRCVSLAHVAGARTTMPIDFYLAAMEDGSIERLATSRPP